MFTSEREMQDTFVKLLKKRKTCGLIFEELGNRNHFFRTDVVEYKSKKEIIGYELKLKDFKKLVEQSLGTLTVYDKSYIVVPKGTEEKLLKLINDYPSDRADKIGIIVMDKNSYKVIKSAQKESTRDWNYWWRTVLIPDLIIRGYYKGGINGCKSYK